MQLTARKPDVYPWSVCRRKRRKDRPAMEVNELLQWRGLLIAVAGFCALLCGLGVISPPKSTSESMVLHFLWIGPFAIIVGLIQFFGSR